jgi:hypothetical protein
MFLKNVEFNTHIDLLFQLIASIALARNDNNLLQTSNISDSKEKVADPSGRLK